MTLVLTIINTAILLILVGDRVRAFIKERILDKTELDEKIVADVKAFIARLKGNK